MSDVNGSPLDVGDYASSDGTVVALVSLNSSASVAVLTYDVTSLDQSSEVVYVMPAVCLFCACVLALSDGME